MTAVREGPEGIPAIGVEEVRLWGLRSVSQELYRYCIILIYVHLHCYANESKFLGSPFDLDLSKDGDKANSTPVVIALKQEVEEQYCGYRIARVRFMCMQVVVVDDSM